MKWNIWHIFAIILPYINWCPIFRGLLPGKQDSPQPRCWGTGFSDSAHLEVRYVLVWIDASETMVMKIWSRKFQWKWCDVFLKCILGIIFIIVIYFTISQISWVLVLPVSAWMFKDSCQSSHTWQLRRCAFEPRKQISRCQTSNLYADVIEIECYVLDDTRWFARFYSATGS